MKYFKCSECSSECIVKTKDTRPWYCVNEGCEMHFQEITKEQFLKEFE